jgi:hypothetical protein
MRAPVGVLVLLVCCTAAWAEDPRDEVDQPSGFLSQVKISGLFFLSYEDGTAEGAPYSEFFVDRAYLTAKARILPFMSARITLDTSQDHEGDGRGDMEVRLKYAFAKFHLGNWHLLRDLSLEAGMAHMVWLDFEEHVNVYRMRAPMFMERSGIFNSADFGVTLTGSLGPNLSEDYRETVNSKYAARHGSFALGVYNGAGYHGQEQNDNKVPEARLTIRPVPDALPGLQVSGLAIVGKGDVAGPTETLPDWKTYAALLSYEHRLGVLTVQYVSGEGNQRGSWTEPDDPSQATAYDGFAISADARLGPHWRALAGYDRFNHEDAYSDLGFDRYFVGFGYDFGRGNVLLLDYDRRDFFDVSSPSEDYIKLTLQATF